MTHAVELDAVTKRFGTCLAVDRLDLRVPEASIYGFIGPNGSGKTTTLRMILRIIYPDSGKVVVLGQARGSVADDRVGYLPEERGLYPRMRLVDLLTFHAQMKGMRSCRGEIDEWLGRLDLGEWANRRVDALSKGMAQKVQFIVALIARPKLAVLDEPFAGLDPVNLDVLKGVVRSLQQNGTTVIFSTHDMHVAERMCDSILMIFRGRKVLDGTLDSIRAQYGEDTIRLRTGEADVALDDLPGVDRVNDYGPYKELRMGPQASPQAILEALVARTRVEHFEITRPSLHDIFVRIAGPQAEKTDEVKGA